MTEIQLLSTRIIFRCALSPVTRCRKSVTFSFCFSIAKRFSIFSSSLDFVRTLGALPQSRTPLRCASHAARWLRQRNESERAAWLAWFACAVCLARRPAIRGSPSSALCRARYRRIASLRCASHAARCLRHSHPARARALCALLQTAAPSPRRLAASPHCPRPVTPHF